MLGQALGRGCVGQQLGLPYIAEGEYPPHGGPAAGEGAGLVQAHDVDTTGGFEAGATAHEDAAPGGYKINVVLHTVSISTQDYGKHDPLANGEG